MTDDLPTDCHTCLIPVLAVSDGGTAKYNLVNTLFSLMNYYADMMDQEAADVSYHARAYTRPVYAAL